MATWAKAPQFGLPFSAELGQLDLGPQTPAIFARNMTTLWIPEQGKMALMANTTLWTNPRCCGGPSKDLASCVGQAFNLRIDLCSEFRHGK
jgi:hypothetical protein